MDLESLRRRLLEARDARAALLAKLENRSGRISLSATTASSVAESEIRPDRFSRFSRLSTVFLSLNVPGPDKDSLALSRVFARGRAALLCSLPGSTILAEGRDALGPYGVFAVPVGPEEAKRACVGIEESLPSGRLIDLDVVGPGGLLVDRASIGLPPRRCLLCEAAAVDCIRAGRHTLADLVGETRRLARAPLVALAAALVDGARAELALTPKPGLVDRLDNGSHPDLSYERMSRAIDTLPQYYEELLSWGDTGTDPLSSDDRGVRNAARPHLADLGPCVAAGLRAEQRMHAAAGSNTHRGYIFLSGLLLLAVSLDDTGTLAGWRLRVASLARRLARMRQPSPAPSTTHGERVRRAHGVGGILEEADAGLPAVFDHGLPALERGLVHLRPREAAHHYLMAVLMSTVEDTTALHRCGAAGLARLKADGAALAALIEGGGDYLPRLGALNDEYRTRRLTMGGVADCLALTLAVHQAMTPRQP